MRNYRKKIKTNFKWTKELVFLITGLLAMIAVTVILALPTKQEKFLEKWSQASLNKETPIVEISKEGIIDKINNDETFFVFYGTPGSEDSITNIKVIESMAQKYKVKCVYWLDSAAIHNATDEEKNTYEFQNNVDADEKALLVKDLTKTTAFFAYEKGEITSDTTSATNATFKTEVNRAFGKYYNANKDNE